jgi:predicted RNA binding protein YcfA (HicA-like mRNA interferase family)
MDKIPPLSGKAVCRVLEKDGFVFIRQTGSHRIYQKTIEDDCITIPVPVHTNTSLKKGTLQAILKKARISRERLSFLLSALGLFLI